MLLQIASSLEVAQSLVKCYKRRMAATLFITCNKPNQNTTVSKHNMFMVMVLL